MSSTIAWYDPALPVPVEYSVEAMEWIRRRAFDGLMALPKVGLGVGGLLIGKREPKRILIVGSRPIECSHASGPSFHLTAEEIARSTTFRPPEGFEIVGCYCSRPRGPVALKEADQALFRAICPAPEQLFLLIRPSATEATRAGFFFRNAGLRLEGGAAHPILPLSLDGTVEFEEAPVWVETQVAPAPESTLELAPEPAPKPVPEPAAPSTLFGEPEPLAVPGFAERTTTGRTVPWKTLGATAAVLALATGSWFTRDQWMPRPPLDLRTAEVDGHFFLEWNRAAVRGAGTGRLVVRDGAASKSIQLDRNQLQAGTFPYPRQTAEVTAVLTVGTDNASTHFKARAEPAP